MTPDWRNVPVFGHTPVGVQPVVRPSAYAILCDDAGHLAIVRTPLGLYLPGGGMEAGESALDTVIRESWEECGLEARVGDWLVRAIDHVYSPSDRCYYEKHSTFVDAQCSAVRGAGSEPDHELEWVTPASAIEHLRHPSHRWAVEQWSERGAALDDPLSAKS